MIWNKTNDSQDQIMSWLFRFQIMALAFSVKFRKPRRLLPSRSAAVRVEGLKSPAHARRRYASICAICVCLRNMRPFTQYASIYAICVHLRDIRPSARYASIYARCVRPSTRYAFIYAICVHLQVKLILPGKHATSPDIGALCSRNNVFACS